MKLKLIPLLAIVILFLTSPIAQATITCTKPASSGFTTVYSPTGAAPNVTQGTVTFTCTRDSSNDDTTVRLRASNGINVCSGSNGATLAGNCISYEAYKDSGCSNLWTNNDSASSISVTLLPVMTPQPKTINFWGCITTNQNVPAGVYQDTVTISIYKDNNGNAIISDIGSFLVTISNQATCSITSIENVAFGTYIAFRNTPLTAPNANIVLNCTSNLPYSLALDATSGVVAGLNYSLALSTSSSSGTGPGQTHTISGTMPANQAGTCNSGTCAGSDPHTLTITY